MLFDTVQCNHCGSNIVFRVSKLPLPTDGRPRSSGVDVESLAISCPDCKHVYDYSRKMPFGTVSVSEPLPEGGKLHELFAVSLGCGQEGCEGRLLVVVPRAAGTTKNAVQDELEMWTLHDLRCTDAHPLQSRTLHSGEIRTI